MTIDELKDLILWAKSEKVTSIKVGEVEFQLSPLALAEGLYDLSGASESQEPSEKPLSDRKQPDIDEDTEDLFWSANT